MSDNPLQESDDPLTDASAESSDHDTEQSVTENPFASPRGIEQSAASFSLSGLLLAMTLFCICMAVTLYIPGLGILMFVLSAPAVVRTWWIRNRRIASNEQMSIGDKIVAFVASLAIVSLITAASVGTFAAVCFPMGFLGFGVAYDGSDTAGRVIMIAGWVLGIAAGGMIAFFFIRWFWRLGVR